MIYNACNWMRHNLTKVILRWLLLFLLMVLIVPQEHEFLMN